MVNVGVLALQGAVSEHICALQAVGTKAVPIKKKEQLQDIDGLILPGGESTTMRRLIDKYNFFKPLKEFGASGKPIFGTCAGLILMAKKIVGQKEAHLGFIDMTVERNAFGRQVDSFEANLMITGVANDFPGVFIRAPKVVEVGEDVEIICKHNNHIVAVRQEQFLACSFHPELTDDVRMAKYFVNMVEDYKQK